MPVLPSKTPVDSKLNQHAHQFIMLYFWQKEVDGVVILDAQSELSMVVKLNSFLERARSVA